jgi:uracil-DNA glycosylase
MNEDLWGYEDPWALALQTQDWPPRLKAIKPAWTPTVKSFFESKAGLELTAAVQKRLKQGAVIYPPKPLRLLEELSPEEVRVVILGQDPYHGPGQAEGLSFSVANGVKAPPSLMNIFKEIRRDLGHLPPLGLQASLMPWVQQGVFLLNQSLSVEAGRPSSHGKLPWSVLTQALLSEVLSSKSPCVFMLWGLHAQKNLAHIESLAQKSTKDVLVLSCNHPSPLSALKGAHPFIGCGHFGLAKRWLKLRGVHLDWSLS